MTSRAQSSKSASWWLVEKKYDTKECQRLYKKSLGVTCKGVLFENQGAHVGARNGMDVRLHL